MVDGVSLKQVRRCCNILGVPVSILDINAIIDTIADWIATDRTCSICAADIHSVILAQGDARYMDALRSADLVIPSGRPLTWKFRLCGEGHIKPVSVSSLMLEVCKRSTEKNWRHYFYGGAENVAGRLAHMLSNTYPGLNIAGTYCPPLRQLTPSEIDAAVAHIRAARPDIVWVGLGCPTQELWMAENRGRIDGAILIGVGAAFDFYSRRTKQARLCG
jgi:N-acetylglucosaminyldiphosphoundecaprenol N-acetyl-beta-D-mannosaminyltransferase